MEQVSHVHTDFESIRSLLCVAAVGTASVTLY
jgi:hypothetical protein